MWSKLACIAGGLVWKKNWGEVRKTACPKTKLFRILRPPVDGKNWLALCIWLVNQNRVNMQVVWSSKLWHFWMNLYTIYDLYHAYWVKTRNITKLIKQNFQKLKVKHSNWKLNNCLLNINEHTKPVCKKKIV